MKEFSVLASSTVTNTGPTVISESVGCFPGSSITGFPPGTANSVLPASEDAKAALLTAQKRHSELNALPGTDLSGKDLGGMTLEQGVYRFTSSAQLTGKLALSGDGDFVFLIASTLTTGTKAVVEHTGKGKVTWLVGSSATLGTGTEFVGDIIAKISISLTTGASVRGQLVALNGAVTLDSNEVK